MSQETKRLFWAAKPQLPQTILTTRNDIKSALHTERLKWVPPENLHFTLKFLGDTSSGKLEPLIKIGHETALDFNAFDLKIIGFGAFYTQKNPKVLFFKTDESEMLHKLAKDLDTACAQLGFATENRPFKAHLTLARVKRINNPGGFQSLLSTSIEADLRIDRLYLIESKLQSRGAEYKILSEFLLR